ncbi:TadE/TadG family type IV pilus assembly protein [Microvirga sp. CF3062]|uniref:TadE/TadG family type IV pilus assembly protein n=1 Tax=Microvirga sp. CF3062 TaxID=3110182 RepID=UPI002E793EB1|nr:TadE/TadG family type IV pilus assembly protein [Microvirga sp. CF3062]MEE1656957.1 TadE/TadG family type IV pilus assembly protein [Microvirga sp. CF3062]
MREDSGSFAVEFAFVAPFLILIMGGIVEGSLLFYTWGNMEHIGRQAARAAAVGEFTREEAQDFIVSRMAASIGGPAVTAVVSYETGPDPIDSEVIVDVTVPVTELSKFQPFGLFRLVTLSTRVTMHREVSS